HETIEGCRVISDDDVDKAVLGRAERFRGRARYESYRDTGALTVFGCQIGEEPGILERGGSGDDQSALVRARARKRRQDDHRGKQAAQHRGSGSGAMSTLPSGTTGFRAG